MNPFLGAELGYSGDASPINPIRSRWIRPAPGPLWTHLLEVPLLEQKELDLGHDKTDLESSGSAIILFYLAVCQPDHIYTRYIVMSPVLVLREAASLIYEEWLFISPTYWMCYVNCIFLDVSPQLAGP